MTFLLFLAAASIIALSPGPGILYVAARTIAGGRGEGLASSLGTAIGGLVHVLAGAVGVSALVMASAEAFTLLKLAGALYLLWLGLKTMREARTRRRTPAWQQRAFRDGILVEALNSEDGRHSAFLRIRRPQRLAAVPRSACLSLHGHVAPGQPEPHARRLGRSHRRRCCDTGCFRLRDPRPSSSARYAPLHAGCGRLDFIGLAAQIGNSL